ncbi:MAG: aminotransferase class I/II-fold pyridoxal phosphate-dependent enzyme [Actinomycetota bacterium]|nr:aminotransferase class I/II-fold pyridoxal phosphate-dependent enzyme [Actinomycetota bacterium]
MAELVDLRSDTVTRPTGAMRAAMASAQVGDDVYGEDPSVNRLEELAAETFQREAALLTPSGVMANQLWLRVLAEPGREVIVEADAHLVNYEDGAGALLGGVQFRTLATADGLLEAAAVEAAIRPDAYHLTPTALVAVEQTHNRKGGTVYELERLDAIAAVTRRKGVGIYLDGARIFNAAVATATRVADYAQRAEGLMFSLSKGLGAPVGSMMVGDAEAIAEARHWRRRYGGAMRQAGVLAAAGVHALRHHVERLADDHENARLMAVAIKEAAPEAVDLDRVETNMVYISTGDHGAPALAGELASDGILVGALGPETLRLVTHLDVATAGCRRAAERIARLLTERAKWTSEAG